MAITLSILNGFSNFFHCWKENKIFYKTHIILLAIPSVCWQSYHHEFSYYVLGHSVYRRSILHSHTRWHQVMKRFVDYSNENWVGLVRQMAPNHFCKIDEDGAGWCIQTETLLKCAKYHTNQWGRFTDARTQTIWQNVLGQPVYSSSDSSEMT